MCWPVFFSIIIITINGQDFLLGNVFLSRTFFLLGLNLLYNKEVPYFLLQSKGKIFWEKIISVKTKFTEKNSSRLVPRRVHPLFSVWMFRPFLPRMCKCFCICCYV